MLGYLLNSIPGWPQVMVGFIYYPHCSGAVVHTRPSWTTKLSIMTNPWQPPAYILVMRQTREKKNNFNMVNTKNSLLYRVGKLYLNMLIL